MSAAVLPFALIEPVVELWSPGRLYDGRRYFLLDCRIPETSGGGKACVWGSVDPQQGREAAQAWQAEGIRLVDRTREGGSP